jgi:hypothetical protein
MSYERVKGNGKMKAGKQTKIGAYRHKIKCNKAKSRYVK